MTVIRVTATAITVVMVASIALAMATGDFVDEGGWILDHAWGRMTLIDLYAGLVLFAGWVILREKRVAAVLLWIPAFIVLGNAATALYAAIAAFRSSDIRQFLLGARSAAPADS